MSSPVTLSSRLYAGDSRSGYSTPSAMPVDHTFYHTETFPTYTDHAFTPEASLHHALIAPDDPSAVLHQHLSNVDTQVSPPPESVELGQRFTAYIHQAEQTAYQDRILNHQSFRLVIAMYNALYAAKTDLYHKYEQQTRACEEAHAAHVAELAELRRKLDVAQADLNERCVELNRAVYGLIDVTEANHPGAGLSHSKSFCRVIENVEGDGGDQDGHGET
ncbi:hypothetical protein LTR78_007443 [Recurvomyces mirabilis]|uniref:Uncharacterized protein n=1 Tax=Recurvomyces mirabilis TaxID=574656 RepID=A0AAE0TT17_9PEZI|nr:hypothetical protein LTR78_007443 [Recurvomyces mirabilis]KAK4551779.1 hypothetical protein LTR86_010921 [Recurvomyces mirabilis]KAK5160048.1 hypothetical protein LTS14_002154 [Recurvomyces mirabilis]